MFNNVKREELLKELLIYSFIALLFLGGGYAFQMMEFEKDVEVKIGNYIELGVTDKSPIVVFAKKGCPACKSLDEFFNERGIQYVKNELGNLENKKIDRMYQTLGYDIVPIILIGDILIPGFQQNEIEKALSKLDKDT